MIEQGLSDPSGVMLASIDNATSSDPAFLRLIDRIATLSLWQAIGARSIP